MSGTLDITERRVMGAVGAVEPVLKMLKMQTTTLIIAPVACCAGVIGTTVAPSYRLHPANSIPPHHRMLISVVVLPNRYNKIA